MKASFYFSILFFYFQVALAQPGLNFQGQINYTQAVNDIWGYTDASGKEYALVGTQTGLAIVDVSIPSAPVELHFITGPTNTWRDVHTWGQYAYMVTEASNSGGLLIIDLSGLPTTISTSFSTLGIGYYSTHAMYIDDATGRGYLFGSKSTVQGNATFIIDIAANPLNPTYLGKYTAAYVHDGYVRNDTMWTCEIYAGRFAAVDVSNPAIPVVMATQATPGAFAHACWLSDNSNYLFVTDEVNAMPVTAYDVSDISDIKEVDRYNTLPVSDPNVVAHNLYVRNDFLITSYYTRGVTIADITYPYNIIEVAHYDTSPLTGGGFNGCWGVYPYFGSQTIVASDRQEGLFVLSPNYVKACYLEGNISNIVNGSNLANVQVQILGQEAGKDLSDFYGNYATGTALAGTYQVVASATGYYNDTISVVLSNGVLTTLNFQLVPITYCSQAVQNLTVGTISVNTAELTWSATSDAMSYQVHYTILGSNVWQTVTAPTPTIMLQNLLPATNYEAWVQGACNFGLNSMPSDTVQLTTLTPPCDAPTNIVATPSTNTTNTTITLQWAEVAYGTHYTVEYRETGAATWTIIGGINTNTYTINSIIPCQSYEYRLKSYCAVGNQWSAYTAIGNVNTTCFVTANLKVFLRGAYLGLDSMRTTLRDEGLLPNSQPYNTDPWYYNGTEASSNLPIDAVDWVLLELRNSNNTSIVEGKTAAILRRNGSLVNADGTSNATFYNVQTGSYYIVVRHRNHIAVASSLPITLPNISPYNFGANNLTTMGNNQQMATNAGQYAMRPGDLNSNGLVTVGDFNLYIPQSSQLNVYSSADLDLNSNVLVSDFNLYVPNSSFIAVNIVRY